jgi:sugar lactone lactonase YvrE
VFADGFAGVDTITKMNDALYRPMGLAEGPDGSLYISDSKKGKIWRVFFKGDKARFGDAQLATMEKSKSKSYIRMPEKDVDLLPAK